MHVHVHIINLSAFSSLSHFEYIFLCQHCFFMQPLRGIGILVTAINKIQLFPTQLTSVHGDLCQVSYCIECVVIKVFSSPEPLGSQGELIGWP